ncbi:hypothetical protein BB559_004401 [Furculomyces boomerangus]|uniref:Uncharacterized protein n=1 Tax=Furculomyces boomerangus TaxID=61424 RepID=A0A2T9YEW5_9FUNG|nr:hypothetical protein BB559_004401 [Furculomyces boomerangus]
MNTLTNINKSLESSAGIEQSPELQNSCSKKFDRRITIPLIFLFSAMGLGNNASSLSLAFSFQINLPQSFIFIMVLVVISTIVYEVSNIVYSLMSSSVAQLVVVFLTFSYRRAMNIVYITGGLLSIIAGIVLFFTLEESPENAEFLTEEERKNAVEILSLDRGLITDVKEKALCISKGFKNKNIYMTSVVYTIVYVSNSYIYLFYVQSRIPSNNSNRSSFNLYKWSNLLQQLSFAISALLILFSKPIKRVNVGLGVLFMLASLFTLVTILVSNLTEKYVVMLIFGNVMSLFYGAIQIHILVLFFTFTEDPNTRIFSIPTFLVSSSVISIAFGAMYYRISSLTYLKILSVSFVPIAIFFSYLENAMTR